LGESRATRVRIVQSALLAALLLTCFDLVWVYAGVLRKARSLELLAGPDIALSAYGTGTWALLVVAALVAAMQIGIVELAEALERRFARLGAARALALASVLASSPTLLALAVYLGSGGWARRYLASWPARLALALALAASLGALLLAAQWLRLRLAERQRRRWRALLGAAMLALAAADYLVLPQLYLPLHGLLMLFAALCAQQLMSDALPEGWRPDTRALAVLAAAWIAALPFIAPWSTRPLANFYVAEFAPFAGKALRVLGQARELARSASHAAAPATAAAQPSAGGGTDLVCGHDLFILSVDGISPFRASLPSDGRATARDTTPFLAEMAHSGVQFARHYTVYPKTEISLLSLLSGIAHDSEREPFGGAEAHALLTRYFKARGYRTYCDLPYAEEMFDDLRSPERCDLLVNYAEAEWNANGLITYVSNADGPVFAIVHFVSTHLPYQRFPDHHFGPGPEDAYDEALAGTDAVLRRLHAELLRLRPGARFVFTSDHGHAFGWHGVSGHGSSVQEDQVRIPLVLHGFDLPAQRVERVSSSLDLFGLLTASSAQRDLALHLGAGTAPGPRAQGAFASLRERRALITERYKLISDPSAGSEALFDVQADPRESRNLIAELPEVASALRAQLGNP
jgi:hypothetical protein